MIGLDAHRPLGRVGGDERVAVAVAADPRTPTDEGRHARRAGPGPRLRVDPARVERRVGRAVQPRHDREQRRVEHGHRRPHLVERLGRDGAQVGGPPQERDLLAQAPPDLAILRRRQTRVVEALEEGGAPSQRDEGGPPSGLGRMGGQDRRDAQAGQRGVQLGVGPAGGAQRRDRLGDRVVQEPVPCGALSPTKRPNAPARLGQVDELEVERERLDDRLGRLEVEGVQLTLEALALGRVIAAPQRDGRSPEPLDQLEQVLPGLLRDDLAQQRAEQPDLARQRVMRPGRPDARRLGPFRGRGTTAHAAASAGRDRNPGRTASQPFGVATFRTLVR